MDTVSVTASRTADPASAVGPVRRVFDQLFGEDGFNFKDVLDLVNPLQHIPVVGNVYRKLTGDVIAPGLRIAGGALFGGPLGAALSAVGLAVEAGARRGAAAAANDGTGELPAQEQPQPEVAIHDPAPAAQTPRGGWMIAAATTGNIDAFVPATAIAAPALAARGHDSAARGGWLLAAGTSGAVSPPAPAAKPPAPARELRLPVHRVDLPLGALTPSLPASPRADARAAALFAALQADAARAVPRLDALA